MRELGRRIWPLLALIFAGCGLIIVDHPWEQQKLDDAVRDMSAEINLHYAMLDGAGSLAAARDEVDRHNAAMLDHERHLRGHVAELGCPGNGHSEMMGLMGNVEGRVATYVAAAAAAPSVESVRGLCRVYAADMDELLDRVRERADQMDCWDH